ncbi:MAG: hypothetical protein LAP86_12800 [Acidobacteriia bacterium]|nr:hypothetical protein [Terriglobia bacterium]
MGIKATTLIAALFVSLISTISQAQEFSADVVYLDTKNVNAPATGSASAAHPSSRLYVSKDKIRLETNGLTGTILLADLREHTSVALQPKKKAYQPLATAPSQYFRVESADDACAKWQSVAEHKVVCEKVGPEVINGRETVKYQNKGTSETATTAVWVDKALKFVVKWQAAGSGAELRNINEGEQAADLFTVPLDYKISAPQKATSKGFSKR